MHVLLVEDHEINQRLVVDLLGYQNHVVCCAENGKVALEILENKHFDLILMDMQMPIMDGYETIGRIREKEVDTHTYIIAMTAFAMDGDRERCLAVGADDYLSKPIKPREFLDLISHLNKNDKPVPALQALDETNEPEVVFDAEKTLKRFMGKQELFDQVVVMFLDRYKKHLSDIEKAILSENAEQVCHTAHAFKGAIGNFGTQIAFEAALQIEEMGRSDNLEQVSEAYEKLKVEIERLVEALRLTQQ